MERGGPDVASRLIELLVRGIAASPEAAERLTAATPVPPPIADENFGAWLRAAYGR